MVNLLHYLFIPHEHNNHKPKVLHITSLILLVVLLVLTQVFISLVIKLKPGVLGYASNISPDEIIALTNAKRQENGLLLLQANPVLSEAARQKAATMFTFGCWSHDCNGKSPWYFFKNVSYDYLYAGENLAKDFGDANGVITAWMNSSSHKENIISLKYKEIGIAVVNGVLNGEETTIVVQLFGTPARGGGAVASAKQNTAIQEVKAIEPEKTVKQESTVLETEKEPAEIMIAQTEKPKVQLSSFQLTKMIYLLLVGLLMMVFMIDALLISRNQIVRISGKSFIHLSFFTIILISILIVYQGKII